MKISYHNHVYVTHFSQVTMYGDIMQQRWQCNVHLRCRTEYRPGTQCTAVRCFDVLDHMGHILGFSHVEHLCQCASLQFRVYVHSGSASTKV